MILTIVGVNKTLDQRLVDSNDTQSSPKLGVDFLRDSSKNHYLTSVTTEAFAPITGQSLSLGFTQDDVWLRIHLPAALSHTQAAMQLVVSPSYIDDIHAYLPLPNGRFMAYRAGDQVPHDKRLPRTRTFAFPLQPFDGWESYPVYIKIASRNVMMFEVSLQSQDEFEASERRYFFWFAALFGLVVFAAFTSIIIALHTKDEMFILYALYLSIDLIIIVALYGYWNWALPIGTTDLILGIGQTIMGLPLFLLISRLLNMALHYPRLYWVLLAKSLLLAILGPLFVLLGYFQPVMMVTHFLVMLVSSIMLLIGLLLIKKEPLARLVLMMFVTFFVGGMSLYAMQFGWLPVNFFTQNMIVVGFILQALLLYVVLGYRMKYLVHAKNTSELRASAVEDEVKQRRLFMNMLNHELRTPMAIIDSATHNLLTQTDHVKNISQQRLAKIRLAVADMRHLMELCLATDRLCLMSQERQSFSLNHLVEAVLAHVSVRHDAERILYEGLEEDVRILGDESLLTLAMGTILDNALNYSASDQDVLLQVSRPTPAFIRLSVTDKGRGFDETFELGKIQRGRNVADTSGLGMGLAMAHEIVTKHRGRLWIDSTSDRGSVVCIELNCLWHLRRLPSGVGVIVY